MQNIIDFLNTIKKMDKKVLKLIDICLWIFFLISSMGIVVLLIHYKIYISAELYYIGIEIFKIGLIGAIATIICSCFLWFIKEKKN